jgi:hypothetical protein
MFPITVVKRGSPTNPQVRRFYCGRGTPLGNPYVMADKGLTERNRVCDAYAASFGTAAHLTACDPIYKAAHLQPVELECFCAPLRCHCDTILTYLLRYPHLPPSLVIPSCRRAALECTGSATVPPYSYYTFTTTFVRFVNQGLYLPALSVVTSEWDKVRVHPELLATFSFLQPA